MKYKITFWKCVEKGNGEYMVEFHTPYVEIYFSRTDFCFGLGLIFFKIDFWIFKD